MADGLRLLHLTPECSAREARAPPASYCRLRAAAMYFSRDPNSGRFVYNLSCENRHNNLYFCNFRIHY